MADKAVAVEVVAGGANPRENPVVVVVVVSGFIVVEPRPDNKHNTSSKAREKLDRYHIPNDNPVDREVAVLAVVVLASPNSVEAALVVPAVKLNPVALLAGAVAAKVFAVVAAPNCKPVVDAGVPNVSPLEGAAEETGVPKFSPTVAGADDAGVPNVSAVAGACEEAGVLKVGPVVGADVRPIPGAEDAEGVPKVKPEKDFFLILKDAGEIIHNSFSVEAIFYSFFKGNT